MVTGGNSQRQTARFNRCLHAAKVTRGSRVMAVTALAWLHNPILANDAVGPLADQLDLTKACLDFQFHAHFPSTTRLFDVMAAGLDLSNSSVESERISTVFLVSAARALTEFRRSQCPT